MGINWAGIGIGYQAATDELRRQADDERRTKDAAFQEESRGRTRTEWKEQDRIRAADKQDLADVNAEFDAKKTQQQAPGITDQDVAAAKEQVAADNTQAAIDAALAAPVEQLPGVGAAPASLGKNPAAPSWLTTKPAVDTSGSPKLDPAVAAKVQKMAAPGGMPAAHNFNDALDRQLEVMRRKSARGDMSPEDYAQKSQAVQRIRDEGIHDALQLMAQGRYGDALDRYNSVGAMRGAALVKGEEGTTTINGQTMPTHLVTIRNADGTRTQMDVTKAQYQLMDFNSQLQAGDRARTLDQSATQHADSVTLSREQMAQQARENAANRAMEARRLALTQSQFEANTPFGRIRATEKALGTPLSASQRAAMLGVDTLRPEVRAQLSSLLKQQEGIETSINKAQADGTWQPDSQGAKEMQTRSAVLNQQVSDLLGKQSTVADPLGLRSPGPAGAGTVPNPVAGAAPASTPSGGAVPHAGGLDLAERDRRSQLFNESVGGGAALARRRQILGDRKADADANFDSNLAAIKRGMTRDEAQRVLSWFDLQSDAGNLSNMQLQQVRRARHAAGL